MKDFKNPAAVIERAGKKDCPVAPSAFADALSVLR